MKVSGPLVLAGIEGVVSLPVTDLFEGRVVLYAGNIYYFSGTWIPLPITGLPDPGSGLAGQILYTDGTNANWADQYPDKSGNDGKFLGLNGTSVGWFHPPTTLPPQAGHTGEYLKTDGTAVSWATLASGLDPTLNALAAFNTNGLMTQTALDTFTARSIVAGSSKVAVTDGDGLLGNPSIDVVEANFNLANLSGTLGITHGGTGQVTALAGFNALSPLTTKGDLLTHNGTNNIRLPVGSNGQVLTADSAQASGLAWTSPLTNPMTTAGDIIVGGLSGAATRYALGANGAVYQSNGTTVVAALLVNANVDAAAAIAGTKISPNFGSQNILTSGTLGAGVSTLTSWTVSGGSAANLSGWAASNVLRLRGGTSGFAFDNTSAAQIFGATDTGAATLGPSAGLGSSGSAYHTAYGSIVGFSASGATRWCISNPDGVQISPNLYRNGSNSNLAVSTVTGYTHVSFARVTSATGAVMNIFANYQDAQTANSAQVTTNQRTVFEVQALGATVIGPSADLTNPHHVQSAVTKSLGSFMALNIRDTRTAAQDVGGSLSFSGYRTGTSSESIFAAILAGKENATSGNEAGYLKFYVNPGSGTLAEGLAISSAGAITANSTSNVTHVFQSAFAGATNGDGNFRIRSTSALANQIFLECYYSSTTNAGGLRRDGSSQAIVPFNGSDRRIKENFTAFGSQLSKLLQVQLWNYTYKSDPGSSGYGPIAQELNLIYPEKVVKPSGDDGTGTDLPPGVSAWSVNNSWSYELIKGLQELDAKAAAASAAAQSTANAAQTAATSASTAASAAQTTANAAQTTANAASAAVASKISETVSNETALGTVTWTATVAPSGTINKSYRWSKQGRLVTVWWRIEASVAGTLVTGASAALPAEMPVPAIYGTQPNNSWVATGSGFLLTSLNVPLSQAASGIFRNNSGGYELRINAGAGLTASAAGGSVTYLAAS